MNAKKIKTEYKLRIGDEKYPIYLVLDDDGVPTGLDCKFEVPALSWWEIFQDSSISYSKGELNEN